MTILREPQGEPDLATRVEGLKARIGLKSVRPEALEGRSLTWDVGLRREVDALIDLFYDDIGRIKLLPLKSLFDLFLIKVLVVDPSSSLRVSGGGPAVGEAFRPPGGGAGARLAGDPGSWGRAGFVAEAFRPPGAGTGGFPAAGFSPSRETPIPPNAAERRFLDELGMADLPAGADLGERVGDGPPPPAGGLKASPTKRDTPSPELGVLEYLSDMLCRFLYARELMRSSVSFDFLYSILEETRERQRFQNLFESSRQLGDNALFVTGMFPRASNRRSVFGPARTSFTIRGGVIRPSRASGRAARQNFDREHFIELGRRYYRVAAGEDLAEVVGQREVLLRLSERFEHYREALAEVSQRYILGFDMNVIANKMLDAFNRYRRSGDAAEMESARKYAALLRVDRRIGVRQTPFGSVIGG